MTAFEEFGVLPELGKAIDEMDWTLPTDVQAEAIPLILGGGDVLMAAETGSGKTGAFCLPILQIVWETLKDIQEGKTSKVIQQTSSEWTMSFTDRTEALAVTPDGLRCQSRDQKAWHGCRATKGVHSKGAYYYEAIVTDEGLCRVGWSTQAARLDLGTDRLGFGFGGTGKKSNAKQFDDYGAAYGMNDVIGCLLNLNTGEIRYTKNGEDLGVAFKLDQSRRSDCYFPAVVLKNAEMSFNFGSTPFKHPPPNGYIAICQAPKDCMKHNVVAAGTIMDNKPVNNAPQAIIIEPSRELAEQTCNQITKFKKHLDNPKIRELLVVGGVQVKNQINELNAGIDIVVGTPGRLEDLIQGGYLALTHCRFFVLDEADGLLKAGYNELIERLHRQIPKITSDGRRLQMVVCSATLHAFEVKKMAEKLMHFPTWVDLKGEDAVPETVHHVVALVDPQKDRSWETLRKHLQTDGVHAKDNIRSGNTTPESLSEAVKLLKGEYCVRAIRHHKMDRAIIFCRTKLDCDNLERYLLSHGGEFSCVCLHGDRKPAERKANLEKFKQGNVKFLICTDVAARGIDISGLPFMINVTLPDEKSNYVHRIGRVGRAERMGLAISLVSSVPEKVWYHGEWCSSRGRNCWNTNLVDDRPKGCCIWYNEPQYLADIEEHLNITIQQVEPDMKVPCNEFDGKVVYGEKRKQIGTGYQDHVTQMAPVVKSLQELESQAQLCYLKMHHNASIVDGEPLYEAPGSSYSNFGEDPHSERSISRQESEEKKSVQDKEISYKTGVSEKSAINHSCSRTYPKERTESKIPSPNAKNVDKISGAIKTLRKDLPLSSVTTAQVAKAENPMLNSTNPRPLLSKSDVDKISEVISTCTATSKVGNTNNPTMASADTNPLLSNTNLSNTFAVTSTLGQSVIAPSPEIPNSKANITQKEHLKKVHPLLSDPNIKTTSITNSNTGEGERLLSSIVINKSKNPTNHAVTPIETPNSGEISSGTVQEKNTSLGVYANKLETYKPHPDETCNFDSNQSLPSPGVKQTSYKKKARKRKAGKVRAAEKKARAQQNTENTIKDEFQNIDVEPPRSQPATGREAANDLVVTITDKSGHLNTESSNLILKQLLAILIERSEDPVAVPGAGPWFQDKPIVTDGVLKFMCGDHATVNWLSTVASTITLPRGEKLVLGGQFNESSRIWCAILIPGRWPQPRIITKMLQYQNGWAQVDRWTLHKTINSNQDTYIIVSVPEETANIINDHNRRLAFCLGTVLVKFRDSVGKFINYLPAKNNNVVAMEYDV